MWNFIKEKGLAMCYQITKASSEGALAGVSVYFRRNTSSGGGGGGPESLVGKFFESISEGSLVTHFGGLQNRSQPVQSAIGDPSWCLRSSQDGIKSMRNSFSEASPVRIPLGIDF